MVIRVLVNGAFGRMGQMTVNAILADGRFLLVGQTGRTHHLESAIRDSNAEVVVDFTSADAVFSNTKTIILTGARPVIGTSGLTSDHVKTLAKLALEKKIGGIVAPNFSLGAVVMMKYAAEIARYLPHAEIIEMHHDEKHDSPSGTAIHSAEMLASASPEINASLAPSHETLPHARGAMHHGIPIHAVRLPGLLAHQQILFGNSGETLSLTHNSIDRTCFMPGVLLAIEHVLALDQLVCGLEHIL